jgi:hypothetical protein
MPRIKKLKPRRERPIRTEISVPENLRSRLNESELQDLMRETEDEITRENHRVLSVREMYENAIHESGHAVVGASLGIGPLPPGIKLWRRGQREEGRSEIKWGLTQLCHWTESDGIVRDEIEKSIVSLLAGRQAQARLTDVFREHRWTASQAQYWLANELDGSSRDNKMVTGLLEHVPLRTGETAASLYNSLLDRTQRLLDQNWPAVQSVARALLRTKHYSLGGKMVTKIVNFKMKAKHPTIRRCADL